MNRCLEPTYAFRNFESFSQCFHSWSNATSDSSEAVLEIESDFGKIIQGCLQNYCNSTNSDLGSCGLNLPWDRSYRLTLRPFVDFYSHACNNLNDHANTDIAGPGVCSYQFPVNLADYYLGHYILCHANCNNRMYLAGHTNPGTNRFEESQGTQ